jgi:hypothetical protein
VHLLLFEVIDVHKEHFADLHAKSALMGQETRSAYYKVEVALGQPEAVVRPVRFLADDSGLEAKQLRLVVEPHGKSG